jgi:hypothetical protein
MEEKIGIFVIRVRNNLGLVAAYFSVGCASHLT